MSAKAKKTRGRRWRPAAGIAVKVVGICLHQQRLLVMEVYNDRGRVKGMRPLGGNIEFGETREQALQREFAEELDTAVAILDDWQTFENLYTHAGVRGHELVFGCHIALLKTELYTQELMVFSEDSGSVNRARWVPLSDFLGGKLDLYPDGLLAAIAARSGLDRL